MTAPWAASSLRIRPKEQQSVCLGSSLPGSWSLRCQAVRVLSSPRRVLSRPPPGPWRAPAGSCLPETCPAVCACVCLSESLPLHHSGAREGPGPQRPAAEWLPVHTLPTLSPPTPPRSSSPSPSSPCSSSSCRSPAPRGVGKTAAKRAEKGGEGSAGVFSSEMGAHTGVACCRGRAGS